MSGDGSLGISCRCLILKSANRFCLLRRSPLFRRGLLAGVRHGLLRRGLTTVAKNLLCMGRSCFSVAGGLWIGPDLKREHSSTSPRRIGPRTAPLLLCGLPNWQTGDPPLRNSAKLRHFGTPPLHSNRRMSSPDCCWWSRRCVRPATRPLIAVGPNS